MLRRVATTTTTGTGTTESEAVYDYQYDEQGYPTSLTRFITNGSTSGYTETTSFYYDCD